MAQRVLGEDKLHGRYLQRTSRKEAVKETRTYVPYTPDDLILAVGELGALLACKLGTFEDEEGNVFVSMEFIAKLWGHKDTRKIKNAAKKLSVLDIWHYKSGDGRGHATKWIKGANFATFVTLERVQKMQIKGAKNAPNNKDIIKIDDNKRAHARKINQSKVEPIKAGEPAPLTMEQLEEFWKAFFFGSYAKYEKEQSAYKERVQAVRAHMPEDKRTRMLKELKAGKRWDKSYYVLWYVQNYKPMPPIWFAQDPDLTPAMVGQLRVMKYKGKVAYCKPEDVNAWLNAGARLFNN